MTDERADGEPLPISLVAHHVFCPRRVWLKAIGENWHPVAAPERAALHRGFINSAEPGGVIYGRRL